MNIKIGAVAIFIFGFILLIQNVNAKDYFPATFGNCPRPTIRGPLDVKRFFQGRWYVQKTMGMYLFQMGGTCAATVANVTEDGEEINMIHYQYEPLIKRYIQIAGTAKSKFTQFKGIYSPVKYDALGVGFAQFEVPLVVIDTDYDNWALVYMCKQFPTGFKSEFGWMMTRDRNDRSHIDTMKKLQNLVDNQRFVDEDNTNCGPNEPQL